MGQRTEMSPLVSMKIPKSLEMYNEFFIILVRLLFR